MSALRPDEPVPEEELVHEDDAIIGKALRLSLVVLVVVGGGIGVAFLLSGEDEDGLGGPGPAIEGPELVVRAIEPPEVTFTDVTAAAGLDFERHNGATGAKYLPETMGGGGAFLDHDGDGDPDLVVVDGAPWDRESGPSTSPRLYRNDGGTFTDATAGSGLEFPFQGMGATAGDWDGDGDPDLFLTGVGENRLLRNDGGAFVDVTAAAGIEQGPERWSTSATFLDGDGDGDLDLYVCNYVRWSPAIDEEVAYTLTGVGRAYGPPMNYEGDHPVFYRNEGDGRFTDATEAAGLVITNPATGVAIAKGLGVIALDIDEDGNQDLVVANDTVQNFLFRGKGDGTFEEMGSRCGVAYDRSGKATGAMGIDAAVHRNDGALGLAIGNFANEMSSFFVSQADRSRFADEAIVTGVGAPSRQVLSFGLFFFDYDLDGRLDLFQANGHLEDEINTVQPSQHYEQPAQLFWNAGSEARRTYVEVEAAGDMLAKPLVGRGAAHADIDGDGDDDVLVFQPRGAPLLLRNDQALGHHWLRVRLSDGTTANRDGLGAWVELESGGVVQRRPILRSKSYLCSVEPVAAFGLGKSAVVDRLTVVWPGGARQDVEVPGVDRVLRVER